MECILKKSRKTDFKISHLLPICFCFESLCFSQICCKGMTVSYFKLSTFIINTN